MTPETNRRVGPYEVLEKLGHGGMGTVYLARDVRLDRRVALKLIGGEGVPASDEEAQQRSLHEARAASVLNHPNICHVYDVGGEGRESWIAMEYVEGTSLSALIRTKGRLAPGDAITVGRRIAEALAHAHHRGILHRDLKSANIVCDRDLNPKILDFGIARRLVQDIANTVTATSSSQPTGTGGTLPYMAPESIRGEIQDERSDLWSLGVVLFEMVAGTLPFQGRNHLDLAAAIVHGAPVQLPDDVPAALAQVVTRLLSRDPAARYSTAAEVASALASTAGAQPDAAAAAPGTVRHALAARPGRRWLLAVAAVLVAIAGYVGWRLQRPGVLELTEQRLVPTLAASARSPSYSPDGSMLAFVAPDAAGVQQIWVHHAPLGTAAAITTGNLNASRPRWLPATNQIVFARAGQGIWAISPIGGTPTRLIERGTNPNVSRDGRRLVFEDQRAIWTAAADGSDVRRVEGTQPMYYTLPMAPALSPDGSTIVYFHAQLGPNGDFWTIPAAGGTPTRLTSDLREGGWPVWTADGRSVVFSSARAGSRTLWQIPASGGEPVALTVGAGEDDQPDISGDGRHVAYTNIRNRWDLRVRDLASGEERSVLERSIEMLFPMFSPDGTRLVYFGRSDYAVAIFTIGVDGTDPRQLTAGRELNHMPRWGADGQDVYFFQVSPTVTFRRMSALGGPSTEFRKWEWETTGAPYFDPTGGLVAYTRQRSPSAPPGSEHTIIHDVATGKEREWPEPHTHINDWSPDGSLVAGSQHGPRGSLVTVCRVAEAECRQLTGGSFPKWSPAGDRLYFVRPAAKGGSTELWSIGADGSSEQRVLDLGTFRFIDVFFDISTTGKLTWAPLHAGRQELWTAAVK